MKLHQLRALVAIEDQGSIRAASAVLKVSHAAVAKAVKELEESLGCLLITREPKGISFTPAGRMLLVHARLVVEQLSRAERDLSPFSGAQRTLRFGVAPWIALTYLGDTIRRFQSQMPDVRFEMFEGILTSTIPKLRDGTLDFCIGRPPPAHLAEEFKVVPLLQTTSAVVGRRGHPMQGARSLAELTGAQWILNWVPSEGNTSPDDPLAQHLRTSGALTHSAHSSLIAINLLQQTDMLGVMPWPQVEFMAQRENLVPLPLAETLNVSTTSLISRRGEPVGAVAQCFLDAFYAVISDAAKADDAKSRRVFRSMDGFAPDFPA